MHPSTTHPAVRTTALNIGQLIEEICGQVNPTILIICCSRSYFLKQLIEYTRPVSVPDPPLTTDLEPSERPVSTSSTHPETETDTIQLLPKESPLLQPTLKLIAASSQVKLVFCPTIPTVRAYLSSLPVHMAAEDMQSQSHPARVVITNFLSLHRDTSEFTLQGLSRSFSLVASVGLSIRGGVELIECLDVGDDQNTAAVNGFRPWDVEVPLLSGSVKIGEAGQGWATRKISIRSFADRWFDFG